MKLFITLLLLTSVSSVLAHPEVKLHTHNGTVEHDIELTEHSHTEAE
jgi:hypothetical protein